MTRPLTIAVSTGLCVGLTSFVIPVAIWPGEAELTAPLFCSPPNTTPMVISDTTHDSEGTSTNYTLYCTGPRGTLTNEGFLLPMLAILAAHILIITTLTFLFALKPRRPQDAPPIDSPTDTVEH